MSNNIDRVKRFIEFINREYTVDTNIVFNKWEYDTIIIDVEFNKVNRIIRVIHKKDANINYNYLFEQITELVDDLIVKTYRNS